MRRAPSGRPRRRRRRPSAAARSPQSSAPTGSRRCRACASSAPMSVAQDGRSAATARGRVRGVKACGVGRGCGAHGEAAAARQGGAGRGPLHRGTTTTTTATATATGGWAGRSLLDCGRSRRGPRGYGGCETKEDGDTLSFFVLLVVRILDIVASGTASTLHGSHSVDGRCEASIARVTHDT